VELKLGLTTGYVNALLILGNEPKAVLTEILNLSCCYPELIP
jgi:hypothetical protein